MEAKYNNNEHQKELFESYVENLQRQINTITDNTNKILIQTTDTNGKVKDLQIWRANMEGRNSEREDHNTRTNWLLVFVSSLIGSAGTIIATKLWH